MWDRATGLLHDQLAELSFLSHGFEWIRSMCTVRVSGAELLVTAGENQKVTLWDPSAGSHRGDFQGHDGWVLPEGLRSCTGRRPGEGMAETPGPGSALTRPRPISALSRASTRRHGCRAVDRRDQPRAARHKFTRPLDQLRSSSSASCLHACVQDKAACCQGQLCASNAARRAGW
jgi:hypothetical protein